MSVNVHPNFIKASYLIFACAIIGLGKLFFLPIDWIVEHLGVLIFNFTFFTVTGFIVRRGYFWVRYLLLLMVVLILVTFLTSEREIFGVYPHLNIHAIVGLIERVLIFLATILVFQVSKSVE